MNEETKAEAQARLAEEREQTIERLKSLREALREEVEPATDEGYPDIYEREKNLALLQRLEQKLESINRALRLQEKGDYGVCERCGQKIDPERLAALPDTTLCLKCKQDIERLTRRGVAVGE
jgi:RNA polymerase-binding protein DksA